MTELKDRSTEVERLLRDLVHTADQAANAEQIPLLMARNSALGNISRQGGLLIEAARKLLATPAPSPFVGEAGAPYEQLGAALWSRLRELMFPPRTKEQWTGVIFDALVRSGLVLTESEDDECTSASPAPVAASERDKALAVAFEAACGAYADGQVTPNALRVGAGRRAFRAALALPTPAPAAPAAEPGEHLAEIRGAQWVLDALMESNGDRPSVGCPACANEGTVAEGEDCDECSGRGFLEPTAAEICAAARAKES